MGLTAKQEAFSQAVVSGMNQSDAYRSAYDAGKMKAVTIHVAASQLFADHNVSIRITELKKELSEKSLWTREQSVAVLANVVAASDAKHNDRISAIKVLNDMQGFNAPVKLALAAEVNVNVHFD